MAKKAEYKKLTLLESLIRHKEQGYKHSECSYKFFKEEDIKGVYDYLKKEGIRHEVVGNILKIYWK